MFSLDGAMPNVSKGDYTTCLCASIWRTDSDKHFERHAFLLADRLPAEVLSMKTFVDEDSKDIHLHFAKDPASLIEAFRDFIVEIDVDILTGWNIYGFDMPFLFQEWSS